MKRILMILTVIVVLLAALFVAGFSGARQSEMNTLHVIEHITNETITDVNNDDDKIANIFTFANEIYDENNETMIGHDNGFCIRTVPPTVWECTFTVTMEGGALTVAGSFFDQGDSALAIVGGTGNFIGARGVMTIHPRNDPLTEYDFTYLYTTD